ncbi:protein phosphatase 2C domain-containing protein [Streptomyces sp. Q6]|uniref:Protein phosphatase 2C domain-containing protein n=1 Tax=Streptomyces citrinus TaxID=3118173 RepID=A0ACD5AL37_9ACTN
MESAPMLPEQAKETPSADPAADLKQSVDIGGPRHPFAGLGAPPHTGKRPPRYPPRPLRTPSLHDGDEFAAFTPHVLLDGCEQGRLVVRATSIRGDSHNWEGTCRQDAMLVTRIGPPEAEMLLLAVADGVGSAAYSHIGSYRMSRLAAVHLERDATSLFSALCAGDSAELGALANKAVASAVSKLRSMRERKADNVERAYLDADYATTLHVLLVPTDPAVRERVLFGVGDGGLFLHHAGQWLSVDAAEPPAEGVLDTRTEALPHAYRTVRTRLIRTVPSDVLLLGTDGITNPLTQKDPEFAQLLAGAWCRGEIPSMSDFLWQAQTRAMSYDDDRTVICLWEETA